MVTPSAVRRATARHLERLRRDIHGILPDMVSVRRTLHQNPEIALKEFDTAALVRKRLQAAGIEVLKPLLRTDVVVVLRGKRPGRNVTLRADMDALPLQEKTGLPHASRREGCMHACGHDGHTTMLLGAALILNRLREEFNGSVRCVFQPGEEIVAAGRRLVEKGVLRSPRPDAVFALHAWSGLRPGVIGSKPGVMLAASDFFTIRIKGKGAHGSRPEESIDPILTGARVVESLQSIASREVSALDSVVVSVCRFSGGTNSNVIPNSVEMEGTTRYLKPELKDRILAALRRVLRGVCDSAGASFTLTYKSPYIPTINDPQMVALGKRVASEVLGPANWFDLASPSMGGEDFAYYIRKFPGALFRLGMGEGSAPLHSAYFDFNDKALRHGILFLVSMALEVLRGQS
jgi:amidohydrolase